MIVTKSLPAYMGKSLFVLGKKELKHEETVTVSFQSHQRLPSVYESLTTLAYQYCERYHGEAFGFTTGMLCISTTFDESCLHRGDFYKIVFLVSDTSTAESPSLINECLQCNGQKHHLEIPTLLCISGNETFNYCFNLPNMLYIFVSFR